MASPDSPLPAVDGHPPGSATLRRRNVASTASTQTDDPHDAQPDADDHKDEGGPYGKTPDGTRELAHLFPLPPHSTRGSSAAARSPHPPGLHAVFKIPQTHNMLSSLFDPRLPKSVRQHVRSLLVDPRNAIARLRFEVELTREV